MKLTFQQAAARFGHIDGEMVHVRLDFPATIELDIRFYPWWEHPAYLRAIDRGVRWAFKDTGSAAGIGTVVARGLEVVHLCGTSAIDIDFSDDHPLLWDADPDRRSIIVNSPVDRARLTQLLADRLQSTDRRGTARDVLRYLTSSAAEIPAPCSIGHFPRQVHDLVLGALRDMDVEVLVENPRWAPREPRILVEIDDAYVIANDVCFDVPEFDHPSAVYAGE